MAIKQRPSKSLNTKQVLKYRHYTYEYCEGCKINKSKYFWSKGATALIGECLHCGEKTTKKLEDSNE